MILIEIEHLSLHNVPLCSLVLSCSKSLVVPTCSRQLDMQEDTGPQKTVVNLWTSEISNDRPQASMSVEELLLVASTPSESRISCSIVPEPQLEIPDQRRVAVTQTGRKMSKATHMVFQSSLMEGAKIRANPEIPSESQRLEHHRHIGFFHLGVDQTVFDQAPRRGQVLLLQRGNMMKS